MIPAGGIVILLLLHLVCADSNGPKSYTKWGEWGECPPVCQTSCRTECKQTREKKCLLPFICHDYIQTQQRSCGRCVNNVGNPEDELVRARDHCLKSVHFSPWMPWTSCLDVCVKVRFRMCVTLECKSRVTDNDDAALREEEWCVPPGGDENCTPHIGLNRRDQAVLRDVCEADRHRKISLRSESKSPVQASDELYGAETSMYGKVLNLDTPCGIRPLTDRKLRIVGGKSAARGEWPWQVAIMVNKRKNNFNDFPRDQQLLANSEPFNYTDEPRYVQYCGGTLITAQWVLTAAHCVLSRHTGLRLPNMVILASQTDMRVLRGDSSEWQKNIHKIASVVTHKDFDWVTIDNDIALIKLEKPIAASEVSAFSCVPSEQLEVPSGTKCIAVGWGKMHTNSKLRSSRRLRDVALPLVDRQSCKETFNFTITSNQMCAGYKDGRSDACDGDSGGPLLCNVGTPAGSRWVIYGITSFGPDDGCGIAGKYGVYVKVNNYADWIKKTIGSSNEQESEQRGSKIADSRKKRHRKKKKKRRRQPHLFIPSTGSSLDAATLLDFDSLNIVTDSNLKELDFKLDLSRTTRKPHSLDYLQ